MSVIDLKKENGLPSIKYKVGEIQPATYKSKLVLDDGTRIDIGNNSEITKVGSPQIDDVQMLHKASVIWDVRVVKATSKPGEKFAIKVKVFQQDTEICDPISFEGEFGENQAISWKESMIFNVS